MSAPSLSTAERFDLEYPEDLGDRLAWLENRLQVSRSRILRLMGFSGAEVTVAVRRSWKEIAETHEAQADRAEHLLTHYLSHFDYDTQKAGDFAREFSEKVEVGAFRLSDHIPALASARTQAEQEEVLLCSLQEEGPSLVPAMARLLAAPGRES
jgi:hypothetical protein